MAGGQLSRVTAPRTHSTMPRELPCIRTSMADKVSSYAVCQYRSDSQLEGAAPLERHRTGLLKTA